MQHQQSAQSMPFPAAVHSLLFSGGQQKGGEVILIVLMAHTGQNQLQNDLIVESFSPILTKLDDT